MIVVRSLLVLALLGGAAPGQDPAPVEPVRLSLQDAIRAAFAHNFALQGALLQADAALEAFGASWGFFDTAWFVNASYSERVDAPTPSNFVGGVDVGGSDSTERDAYSLTTGLRGTWLTGTQWQFDVGTAGSKTQFLLGLTPDPTDPAGATVDDSSAVRTAEWGLTLTHPLLRDGADGYALSAVRLAAQDARIATISAASVANETLTFIVTTYWNLVFAIQDVATRELSVELAQELLGITQRKFQQGLQNRIDVIEVEAEVANRREELLTARNTLEQAMDDLRTAVLAPEEAALWARPVEPTTSYEVLDEIQAIDLEQSVARALAHRPDVLEARLQLERAAIEVERARNQTLPRLDVTGGYGLNSNERTSWEALQSVNEPRFHEGRVALDFEVPLANRTAEHTLRRQRIERERASVALRESEVSAVAQVRREARNVLLQLERVRATAETVRLRREVYEGERRRLENDLSTPYLVRESQRDLLSAIDTEVRARLDLAVARTALLAAEGMLLPQLGYAVDLPELSLDERPPAP